ncbi:hypothetical protein ACFL20_00575 [Spirochaetota bacterium]
MNIPSKSLFLILLIFIAICTASLPVQAQSEPLFGFQQNPMSIKWKIIETEHFMVIFPKEISSDAQRVASILEHVYPHLNKTIDAKKRKIPILLYNRFTQSNGFATLGPKRSIWFNTPNQQSKMGALDWYDSLALHETRHILQYDSLDRNTAWLLHVLFGDIGRTTAMFSTIPLWYFEGDAVNIEAALSNAGRARIPRFDAALRAQLLSGKKYTYYQSLFDTYRDVNPLASPYLLGNFLVAKIRRDHGPAAMKKINSRSMWFPLVPYSYTHSMESTIGRHASDLYKDTLKELVTIWNDQLKGLKFTDASPLHKVNRENWTGNLMPQYSPDGAVILYRWSKEDIPKIIKVNRKTGREKTVATTGFLNTAPIVTGTRAVWSEEIPHVRWGMESFSDVYMADITTGKVNRITSGKKYFAPSLSPGMKKIAVVEYNPGNRCTLVILNAKTGKTVQKFTNAENDFIETPRWSPQGTEVIIAKKSGQKGKAVFSCSMKTGTCRELVPFSEENIHSPLTNGRHLFYVSSYSGIDNIYAMDLKTRKRYQVTSRKFGAYYPSLSVDGKKLAFSDVTKDGYIAVETEVDPGKWIPLKKVTVRKTNFLGPIIAQESGGTVLKDVHRKNHNIKDYNTFCGLFNIHSWGPGTDVFRRDISFLITSTNLLQTMNISLGYLFNWNEMTHAGIASIMYAGWFPVIEITGKYGTRNPIYQDSLGNTYRDRWHEARAGLMVSLPFNFSRRGWMRTFTIGAGADYIHVLNMDAKFVRLVNNGKIVPVIYSLQMNNTKTWIRDIKPRWGQVLNASFTHTPVKLDYHGYRFSSQLTLYFPGIFRNNSLFIDATYEMQDNDGYFESMVLFSRGYLYVFHQHLFRGSANYLFPVVYPDLNLYVFHIKQIYMNIFYDHALNPMDISKQYKSTGAEIVFEIFPLGYNLPIHIGARYAYKFDGRGNPHFGGIVIAMGMAVY